MRSFIVNLALIVLSLPVFAQTTGKLAGVVTGPDGEPLPGVNVVIEGSTRGAATNLDGEYFILSVPPGLYTVSASMVGFQKVQYQNVRIQVDRTTTIDFRMQEEAYEGQEVVVTARVDLVTKDQTSASAKVTGDEILALPVDNIVKSVGVQAGVSRGSGGSLHIRGGRSSEIKYYVDGVAVSNPFNNSLATPIENTAVQEVEVISGTYNAEFGQANSGIVNIVTKDGADFYSGTFISSVGGYFSDNERVFYEIDEASPVGEQSY
jgi:outer membrane receptor protein involved in Fe transport